MAAKLEILVTLKDKASKALDGIRGKAGKLGGAIGKVMRAGVLAGGVALAGLGVLAIKTFADFDDAMTKSLAIMGNVSKVMREDMSDAAREVAKTTTFSATEAAEAYFFLASAGLDAAQSIGAMPRVAAFAQAGNFELTLATDLLTDAQSALGLTVDDTSKNIENMARVSDVLIKANTLSNATAQQFSESLTNKAGPALRSTNKSIEEGVAVLAVFADQGIKGAEAGTKLGIVLRDLQTKALKNAGEFDALNISVFDSEGEMRNMADIVGDLEGALDGMSTAQRKATLLQLGFSDKSVSALQALLGSSDALREYQTELEKAGGITDEVASKQLESFSAQLSLLKSAVQDVFITVGSILVPVLLKLAKFLMSDILPAVEDFIKGFRGGFKHMGDDAQGFIGKGQRMGKAIRKFINEARPVVERFFSAFISGIKTLSDVFGPLVRFILDNKVALVAAIAAIGIAILLAFGPGAIAIAAIIGLIVLLGLLRENWDEIKAKITEVIDDIIAKVEGVPVIGEIFKVTVKVIGDKIDALIGFIKGLMDFVKELVTFVSAIFRGDWAAAWDSLKELAKISLNLFLDFLQLTFLGTIRSVLSALNVWDFVKDAFNTVKDKMVGAFKDAVAGIKGLASSFYSAGADLAFGIADGIAAGMNYAIYLMEKGINFIIGAWNSLEFNLSDPTGLLGAVGLPSKITIGTPNIPPVSLPRLHKGGEVLKTGLAEVKEGERYGFGGGGDIFVTVAINTPFNLTSPHDIDKAGQLLAGAIRKRIR